MFLTINLQFPSSIHFFFSFYCSSHYLFMICQNISKALKTLKKLTKFSGDPLYSMSFLNDELPTWVCAKHVSSFPPYTTAQVTKTFRFIVQYIFFSKQVSQCDSLFLRENNAKEKNDQKVIELFD